MVILKNKVIAIPRDKLEIILHQMKKCICKIINNKINKVGYFCKIPFPDSNNLKSVLIVNDYLFKEFIEKEKTIQFTMDKDHYEFIISIDESRSIYNSQFNITIIEIKQDDGLDINSFLEIDDQIFKANLKEIFSKQKTIYTPKEKEFYTSTIEEIIVDKFDFFMDSLKDDDGLLFNLSNCKVIGVKLTVTNNLIKEAFLKIPIIEYFKFNNKNQRI